MKVSDVYGGSSFLRAADLVGKGIVDVTIASVTCESFSDDGSKPKIILSFDRARKKLPLNATNAQIIAQAYGDDTGLWPGRKIALHVHKVSYQGKLVDGIAVIIPAGAAPVAPEPEPLDDLEMGETPF